LRQPVFFVNDEFYCFVALGTGLVIAVAYADQLFPVLFSSPLVPFSPGSSLVLTCMATPLPVSVCSVATITGKGMRLQRLSKTVARYPASG
jgi:hypothetical protein